VKTVYTTESDTIFIAFPIPEKTMCFPTNQQHDCLVHALLITAGKKTKHYILWPMLKMTTNQWLYVVKQLRTQVTLGQQSLQSHME
jgi:hypothetical protein